MLNFYLQLHAGPYNRKEQGRDGESPPLTPQTISPILDLPFALKYYPPREG